MKKPIFWLALAMTGCMLGPNYHTPDINVSNHWETEAANSMPAQKWWEELQDELLNRYVEVASEYNYDIQAAEANILRARALRQIAASTLFPHINFDLNGTKTYFSKNGPVFAIGQAAGNPADTSSTTTGLPFAIQTPQIQNLFNALFDASWELDFFGKNRRAVESAVAELESRIAQRDDILLSVQAEVARNYIDLRGFQRRTHLLEQNIALYEQHAAIIRMAVDVGYANQLDLENIEAQLASAKGALPDAMAEVYRAIFTLSILIGRPPETLVEELFTPAPLPMAPNHVAVGCRSDLLRRRPDVRVAERKLAEATANIGVAVASFFPTVTLLANGGWQSLMLPQLFNWGSRTWAYGADVNMPIFEGGNLVGNLHFTQAEQAYYAAQYQQAVLSALQDAEKNLRNYVETAQSSVEYDQNVRHNELVVAITRERFLKGLINRIDLLNNEKQLISAQLTQLDSKMAELFALIALYKSLGGGLNLSE
ncbi:MAG: efflux transporter outer membrane subunit [Verrucomicrobia bacterium]|nr:efflux transporter outer membrane subunit [Verrucomicrobiota bacterium]